MNAIVEVATLEVVAQTNEVVATAFANYLPVEVTTPVATSTLRAVISVGSHSISAVAPDAHTFEGGLALAAA